MRVGEKMNQARVDRRGFLGSVGCGVALSLLAVLPAQAQQVASIGVMAPDQAHDATQKGEVILVDIRRPEEWLQTGVAEGAIGLDMTSESFVGSLVALRKAYPNTPLALICRTGNRTGHVTSVLAKQGFAGLIDVKEGMVGGRHGPGWLKRGLPIYEGLAANVRKQTMEVLP